MTFDQLVYGSWHATQYALLLFRPELTVVLTILALLFVRLFDADRWLPGSLVAIVGVVIALALATHQKLSPAAYDEYPARRIAAAEAVLPAAQQEYDRAAEQAKRLKSTGTLSALDAAQRRLDAAKNDLSAWERINRDRDAAGNSSFFNGLLVFDGMTIYFRIFLLLFLLFVVYLTTISGIPDREDAPDFYVLLLGATLGMMLLTSANHLLMVFMAVEMMSVPSYAMVGFLKGKRNSSEAALKFVVYGAGAAGVMLYGISLLSGLLGTAHLPEMVQALSKFGQTHQHLGQDAALRTLVLGVVMILVGLAFKLSIFPFHFWCPDAFEGASAEVAGFLSVASKGAAFAILVRLCLVFGGQGALPETMRQLFVYVGIGLGIVAAASATYGNLAAYAQNNMKRMLAYSTIAHAGYMLMAVSAMLVILNAGGDRQQAAECLSALLYYLAAYFFMNLGAFAIVALVRNQSFSEEIDDYAGLGHQSPVLAVCLALCLCSLIGLPPFGGFVGKILVFYNLVAATSYAHVLWGVLILGVLNTVFSLFYYMRVMKVMFFGQPREGMREVRASLSSDAAHYALLTCIPVVLLGVLVDPVLRMTQDVAKQLF